MPQREMFIFLNKGNLVCEVACGNAILRVIFFIYKIKETEIPFENMVVLDFRLLRAIDVTFTMKNTYTN